MSFKENDRVKVLGGNERYVGALGTVVEVFGDGDALIVKLDIDNRHGGFFASELELVDPKREALIELAETLNKARLQANAIDEYVIQSQRGVYGTIALALHDTLEQIIGAGRDDIFSATADRVYDSVLDGNTIREALAAVVK